MAKQLALHGGEKTITESIAVWPQYDGREKQYLDEALRRSVACVSEARPVGFTIQFEKAFADYHHRRLGVACSNCTQGLEAALSIAGIGPGDEVLVPPYTFMATVSSVIRVGAVPVFIDVNPETLCMDLDLVEQSLSSKTKAVIPVHFAGYIDDMERLKTLADKKNIVIIEDAAHAPGACRKGEYAGAFSAGALFSFQRNKTLTAGEGGAFLTDDKVMAEKFREFIWHGTKRNGPAGHHSISSNLRITDFQSAILLGQLEKLDEQNRKRMSACSRLDQIIDGIKGFKRLSTEQIDVHPRYLYIFKIDSQYWTKIAKEKIIECLLAEGVRCSGLYPYPLYKNPVFENNNYSQFYREANKKPFAEGKLDFRNLYLENVETACKEVIMIPHFVFLSEFDVVAKIGEALEKVSKNKNVLLTREKVSNVN